MQEGLFTAPLDGVCDDCRESPCKTSSPEVGMRAYATDFREAAEAHGETATFREVRCVRQRGPDGPVEIVHRAKVIACHAVRGVAIRLSGYDGTSVANRALHSGDYRCCCSSVAASLHNKGATVNGVYAPAAVANARGA